MSADASHSDPFARRVYLQPLADSVLPARCSRGVRRRAAQLQRFLRTLQQAGQQELEFGGRLELLVVNAGDWRKLFSYPYGFPFTRNRPGGGVSVIAAADYPLRLLHRFDDIFVRATQAGEPPPGEARAFLDLLVGHEWGHGAANLSGLRTRVKWVDELMATYLFLAALQASGAADVYQRFVTWAGVGVAGSDISRADLGAFEYTRRRLKLDNLLWFQGVLTLRAAELWEARGWRFAHAMKEALSAAGRSNHRGEVARMLMEAEPSFKAWFKVFAVSGETELTEERTPEGQDPKSKLQDQRS